MFRLIRFIITCACLGSLVYCASTVELGERTFFGHISRIWSSEETQDFVDGVKDKSGPLIDEIGESIKARYDEHKREGEGAKPDKS